jgi:DNA-binding transcriptional ArsR family regulator
MSVTQLQWDLGTAYDLFVSLEVLHEPAEFGVRGAWAAGVRARLPARERETLERGQMFLHVPFHWLYTLPEPKDGRAVLWALGQVPASERLALLALSPEIPPDVVGVLKSILEQKAWHEQERQTLQAAFQRAWECGEAKKVPSAQRVEVILDSWAHAEEFGEGYLEALRLYQEVFFAEEEQRIRPALQQALAKAQDLAQRLTLLDLLEEITQGLRFDEVPEADRLVLAPSYWCTPLVFFGKASSVRQVWLFGARPADASLVPGETVPESLLRALKALSDPTRLRIMRYLAQETLSPAELSRRLRLRAPTVTHHLKILRLAGLVQMTLGEGGLTKCYAARREAVAAACTSLESFLE